LLAVAGIAFAGIGYLAFRLYGHFIARIKVEGGFNFTANNSFGQILPAFAFAMIGVGLAAPAAMSTSAETAPLWHAARNCRCARRVTRPITSPNGAARHAASSYI